MSDTGVTIDFQSNIVTTSDAAASRLIAKQLVDRLADSLIDALALAGTERLKALCEQILDGEGLGKPEDVLARLKRDAKSWRERVGG